MIRPLAILILVIGLAAGIRAQDKPSFVSIQAGASFPLGGYHDKSLPEGGFALPGFSLSGEGAWFFSPHWGIGGYAGYHAHPVDVRVLGYEKVLADISLEDVTIRSDPYRVYNLMAGIFTSWPVMNNLRITGKAAGGVTYAATPYQLYKAEYFFIGRFWYDITSAGDFEASFVAGTGLEYKINDCLGFRLQGDFTYNAMEFDFATSDGSVRTDHHKIVFLNVSAGVVFNL